jgi:hypothetical protein
MDDKTCMTVDTVFLFLITANINTEDRLSSETFLFSPLKSNHPI